jgi:guanylate kinase
VKRIYDYIVVNDEVGKAADALIRILDENRSRAAATRDKPSTPNQPHKKE